MTGGPWRLVAATAVATTALLAAGYGVLQRRAPSSAPPRPLTVDVQPATIPDAAALPPTPEPPHVEPEPAPPDPPKSLEEVVSRSMPAVVRVEVPGGIGSGFFIRPDTIVTNAHVVTTNAAVTVRMPDGRTRPARVETTAPELDIAILRVPTPDAEQVTLPMISAVRARQGQEVVVLGTPLGLQNTVTRGIVSAVRQVGPVTLVQTDAAVNPGNSGGPVLDRDGNVIGIATMTVGAGVAQGLSFAVAIDHAQALLAGHRPQGAAATPIAGLSQAMGNAPSPPARSETETRREQGARDYEAVVVQTAREADQLDGYWAQFRRVCYSGEIGGGFTRDWFAVFDSRAMRGTVAPGCAAQFAEVLRVAQQVRDRLVDADETARKADVYPGTRRDLLRRYRLDYQGWSR